MIDDAAMTPRFATLALHAGARRRVRASTALLPPWAPALDAADSGDERTLLEERLATLEGGSAAVALVSGGAALVLTLRLLLAPGDEAVCVGPSIRLGVETVGVALEPFGWRVKPTDADDLDAVEAELTERTRLIFASSIARDGGLRDIARLAAVARRNQTPLVVDNTIATPFLFRPLEHGADIALQSTGLLSGAEREGGLIIEGGSFDFSGDRRYPALSAAPVGRESFADSCGNFAFAAAARAIGVGELGIGMSRDAAAGALVGLTTLALRLHRQSEGALAAAQMIKGHRAVAWTRYPGLDGDPDRGIAQRLFREGAGPVLSFALAGGADATRAFLGALRIVTPDERFGGARTIVRASVGAGDLALCVGLEDPIDIARDLRGALDAAA